MFHIRAASLEELFTCFVLHFALDIVAETTTDLLSIDAIDNSKLIFRKDSDRKPFVMSLLKVMMIKTIKTEIWYLRLKILLMMEMTSNSDLLKMTPRSMTDVRAVL
jgi:hypothetical protein